LAWEEAAEVIQHSFHRLVVYVRKLIQDRHNHCALKRKKKSKKEKRKKKKEKKGMIRISKFRIQQCANTKFKESLREGKKKVLFFFFFLKLTAIQGIPPPGGCESGEEEEGEARLFWKKDSAR
jgi:hypothetical protein